MNCRDCELRLAEGVRDGAVEEHLSQCAQCRMLAADLAANAAVFEGLRSEELPPIAVRIPRRRWAYGWAAAIAAVVFVAALLPRPQAPPPAAVVLPHPPQAPVKPQPLKIKMLTPDPNVVIYWLIDN
jgi:hypothetical protein